MNIRQTLKHSRLLAGAAYRIREIRIRRLMKKYSRLPLDSRKVFFYRSGGGYGDNPRAVAEYLHRHHPEIHLVWACGSEFYFKSMPDYVKPVLFESEECCREMATAGAWVCSTTLPGGTVKRPGQMYIQTWHGDKGFKKFGLDATDLADLKKATQGRTLIESEICDYFLTGAEWFVPKIRSAIGYEGEILTCGLPRNDCLIHLDETEAEKIRAKLGIEHETRVLIYAPTFRDHEGSHEVVGTNIDLPAIVNALESSTENRWICLLKAHAGKQLMLHISDHASRFIDVTAYPDIADLLMISDMMITDYSSCAGDFSLLNRPILLYQDDIDSYTSRDRTLYFRMEDTPYLVAHDTEEALALISQLNERTVTANCEAIRSFYQVCETGKASETVAGLIEQNRRKMEDSQ